MPKYSGRDGQSLTAKRSIFVSSVISPYQNFFFFFLFSPPLNVKRCRGVFFPGRSSSFILFHSLIPRRQQFLAKHSRLQIANLFLRAPPEQLQTRGVLFAYFILNETELSPGIFSILLHREEAHVERQFFVPDMEKKIDERKYGVYVYVCNHLWGKASNPNR